MTTNDVDMNNPAFLSPSSSSRSTAMSSANTDTASEATGESSVSGQNSPDSTRSRSPVVSFDVPLDPSDPLSFLMDGVSADSSAEESYITTSTPPSSHDSPSGGWTSSTTSKDAVLGWQQQPDMASLSFDSFDSVMNIMQFDPAALGVPLQFDPALFSNEAFALPMESTAGNLAAVAPPDLSSYPFSFNTQQSNEFQTLAPGAASRRLSVTSSSSSSGASLSPVVEHTQTHAPVIQTYLSGKQSIDELADRARQAVGVIMALPNGMDQGQPGKLPIPRLQRPAIAPFASSNRRKSPSTTSPASQLSSTDSITAPAPLPTRTKTSHTTIERRYRTNLNARIQSLRAAVPALRVLEIKAGNRVGNLALKAGTRRAGVDVEPGMDEEDVIDERGFVDGVKVARKGSKANVLGKAVEYIRVLKRRELRLKREQDGLKTLVRSLVGGSELLDEWEAMWRDRFGGAEKDEVEGEDGEADDENDDDEDEGDDAEDVEDDENGGKKRKRAKMESQNALKGKPKKLVSTVQQTQTIAKPPNMVSGQPEKRKRGRPRKVPLPPVIPNPPSDDVALEAYGTIQHSTDMVSAPGVGTKMDVDGATGAIQNVAFAYTNPEEANQILAQPQIQSQSGQYLLAAFAFFSFFNSPASHYASSAWGRNAHSAQEHSHTGAVLGQHLDEANGSRTAQALAFGWRDAVQVLHVFVSFLLLVSVVTPWLPRVLRGRVSRLVPRSLKPLLGSAFPGHAIFSPAPPSTRNRAASSDNDASDDEKADASARSALLSSLHRGKDLPPPEEVQALRAALQLSPGVFGLLATITCVIGPRRRTRSRFGLERRMLEQRVFMRLAGLVALDARAPNVVRAQTYLFAFKFLSVFSASAADLATLALVIRPVWRSKAISLWTLALSRAQGKGSVSPHISRAFETFVLESMTIDEATQNVARFDLSARLAASDAPSSPTSASTSESDEDNESRCHGAAGPLAALASHAVRDYVRNHVERVFLQSVSGEVDGDLDGGEPEAAEREMRRVVVAGRSLDAQTAKLVDFFERVCNPTSSHLSHALAMDKYLEADDNASGAQTSEDSEIRALLYTVVLHRRIFPSTLLNVASTGDGDACRLRGSSMPAFPSSISISLTPMPSPPPSPSRKNAALHLSLRRCLDSTAFDRGDALEDARDRVVDMLTSESAEWPKHLQH